MSKMSFVGYQETLYTAFRSGKLESRVHDRFAESTASLTAEQVTQISAIESAIAKDKTESFASMVSSGNLDLAQGILAESARRIGGYLQAKADIEEANKVAAFKMLLADLDLPVALPKTTTPSANGASWFDTAHVYSLSPVKREVYATFSKDKADESADGKEVDRLTFWGLVGGNRFMVDSFVSTEVKAWPTSLTGLCELAYHLYCSKMPDGHNLATVSDRHAYLVDKGFWAGYSNGVNIAEAKSKQGEVKQTAESWLNGHPLAVLATPTRGKDAPAPASTTDQAGKADSEVAKK
jgi:hypothetical protein